MKSVTEKQKTAYESLKEEQGYTNPTEVPRLEKLVVSVGIGSVTDKNKIELIQDRLALITGQKPVPTRAKKSIAAFKSRAGDVVGYKVTLRGMRAHTFLDKLIHIAFPRMRDFRGIDSNSIDEMGNITLGLPEHTVFPETSDEELSDVFGMAISIVTTAEDETEAEAFLSHLEVPFKKREDG